MSAAQLQVREPPRVRPRHGRSYSTLLSPPPLTATVRASQQTQSRKLQNLRDRLTIRQDDIVHTKALLQKEGVELGARREQRDKVQERIASVLKEMDDEAAAREEAKAARLAVLAEEEYLRDSLAAILQTEVEELRLGLQKKAEEAQQQSLEIDDGTVREVSVHFETEEVPPPPPLSPPRHHRRRHPHALRHRHRHCPHPHHHPRHPLLLLTGGLPRERHVHLRESQE